MGFGIPSRAPTRASARPIVQTARRPALSPHLEAEQLARPARPHPPELVRRPQQKRRKRATERVVDLRGSVAVSLVIEPIDAFRREVVGSAHDCRPCHAALLGDSRTTETRAEAPHDVEPHRRLRVAAPATKAGQVTSRYTAHSRYIVHARGSLAWWFGNCQTEEAPRGFPSIPIRDRRSRSVI